MHNDKAGCLGLENTQKELATEKQVRIEADAQLMQNMASLEIAVTNEATNRQEADTALQTAIDNEAITRQEADNALREVIDGKAALVHVHDDAYYTKSSIDSEFAEVRSEISTGLSTKASTSHSHDDRYYTESEINSKLANYANVYIGSSQPSSSESAKLWVVI